MSSLPITAKSRILLYGGSFDPPTIAHRDIIHGLSRTVDPHQIWLVVCPSNPLKPDAVAPLEDRLNMVNLLCEEISGVIPSPISVYTGKTEYYQFLREIRRKFHEMYFLTVMGSDAVAQFEEWEEHQYIAENSEIMWFPRDEDEPPVPYRRILLPEPSCNSGISSTLARGILQDGVDPWCIPEIVLDYIREVGLYKKAE